MRKGSQHTNESREKIRLAREKQGHPFLNARGITPAMVEEAKAAGMRWCSGFCKTFIPTQEFNDGEGKCRKCHAAMELRSQRAWSPEKREHKRKVFKDWDNKDPVRERRYRLMYDYGVTLEWFEETLAKQGGHCALCDKTDVKGRRFLFVDHDHETGQVRGILCYRCNTHLATMEIPGWAERALEYLKRGKRPLAVSA